jgi:hypothetical protein
MMQARPVTRPRRIVPITLVLLLGILSPALAQEAGRVFVGGLFGVSTLSADARAVTSPDEAHVSLYKPENGPAVNALAGVHATRFVSVQANYIWNRNDLTLLASSVAPAGGVFYEQARPSTQHAVFADALLYFRSRDSGVRPYLSGGLGLVRFESDAATRTLEHGMAAPSGAITATRAALRVAVGIDLRVAEAWSLRYSFSEAISGNPVSARLTPPAERNLMNFQNLFGLVLGF